MRAEIKMSGLSDVLAPKECEAALREEDDFMIRHGWYMSCFYEAWRDGRGRAIEKKRAAERAKIWAHRAIYTSSVKA